MHCYCCSKKKFSKCCKPILTKKKIAETPLELMRSRYSAYATNNLEYIKNTAAKTAAENFNLAEYTNWNTNNIWLGLRIIRAPTPNDNFGEVEFIAYYRLSRTEHTIHEQSIFEKINNKWFYIGEK